MELCKATDSQSLFQSLVNKNIWEWSPWAFIFQTLAHLILKQMHWSPQISGSQSAGSPPTARHYYLSEMQILRSPNPKSTESESEKNLGFNIPSRDSDVHYGLKITDVD